MMKATVNGRVLRSPKIPKTYARLMQMHMIRPIRVQEDAENVAGIIDLLASHDLNEEQADYLELLSDTFEKWCATGREGQRGQWEVHLVDFGSVMAGVGSR